MKKLLCALSFTALWLLSFTQDETIKKLKEETARAVAKQQTDTVPKDWHTGGLYSLNMAQGSLSNWAAGGDNFSLAVTSYFNVYAFYKKGRHSWDNTFDFNFGYVNTTSLGSRKNDDRVDLLSKYGYGISKKWSLSTLFNFRSQIAKGYNYPDNIKTFTSAFLAPAYVLLSVGFDYKPNNEFSIFISPLASRWVIVKDDSLSAKGAYGVTPGKHSNTEFGAFISAGYMHNFSTTVQYKGRLDLFSNYKKNPQNVDVLMTNLFAVKLSKILSATWNLDLIYDDDVRLFGKSGTSPALQLKSLIGLGLMVKF